jgi:uncharacterized protein YjiK
MPVIARCFKPVLLALLFALAQGCSLLNGDSEDSDGDGSSRNFDILDYKEYIPVTDLTLNTNDLSGITYNFDRDTFYLIENNSTIIWEVTTSYQLVRTIYADKNFGDTEDITYLGNSEFAIVTEEGYLYIGTIADGVTDIFFDDFQEIKFAPDGGNSGPEGVAFDFATQIFYIVKEQSPKKVYSFVRPAGSATTVTPTEPFDAEDITNPSMADMSGVVFNPATGRLLILSDLDYRIIDIALDGTVFGKLDFAEYEQYEGIALDDAGNIHLVGEPRFFHVWSPH